MTPSFGLLALYEVTVKQVFDAKSRSHFSFILSIQRRMGMVVGVT